MKELCHKHIERGFECYDIHSFVQNAFGFLIHWHDTSSSGLQVRASKGYVSLKFHIDMLRTPYFFKDRNITVNHNGRKKRIFHIVRTHKRGDKYIKSHFRGLRKFKWHNYDIVISMPGKHHDNMLDCDLMPHYDNLINDKNSYVDETILHEHVKKVETL